MITLRPSHQRGHFNHGWLDTYHTFSFADYRDPQHTGFRSLRVINEDRVAPGQGFGEHPHRDMEIITYVLSGELEHRDSLGNRGVIRPGRIQYMAAGSGILHSEFNPSASDPVHLMQIWIMPDRRGAEPGYEEREFPTLSNAGRLTLLASGNGRSSSIRINQDADVYAGALQRGTRVDHELGDGRGAWIQVLRGSAMLAGDADSSGGSTQGPVRLVAGDGASVENESRLRIEASGDAELLLFDLGPMADRRGPR